MTGLVEQFPVYLYMKGNLRSILVVVGTVLPIREIREFEDYFEVYSVRY